METTFNPREGTGARQLLTLGGYRRETTTFNPGEGTGGGTNFNPRVQDGDNF